MKTRLLIIIGITVLGISLVSVMNNGHDLFHYMDLPYEWHDFFGFTDSNFIRSSQCSSEELGWLESCNDVRVIPDDTPEQLEAILEYYKTFPEVVAFYAKYDDAQASVHEDYVSYFAGNEDDFRIRMNLEFDKNYEVENIELHCYVKKVHQTESSPSFALKFLKDYTCDENGAHRDEN